MSSKGREIEQPGERAGPLLPAVAVERLLHAAVEHQRDAVLITEADRVDPGGRRIVYANPAFTAMTGFTFEETVGRTPDLTVGEKTDRAAIRRLADAVERKVPAREELLKYRKDGSTFWVEMDIAPVVEPDGRCRYFVAVIRDVGEKKRAEELMEQQALELERALRLKAQFLANMSHELRTPLNAIVGYTSLLLESVYGPMNEAQRKAVRRIDSNSNHLLGLINEVLDFGRLQSGRTPIAFERFQLIDVVNELFQELDSIIARSKLTVCAAVPDGLPPLHSDRQKVKQILLNLLSNAIKFTPSGWVRVSARADASTIAVSVADSGVGIAPEHHEQVFEHFWQVDGSPTRQHGGTGLGLSICRRLAGLLAGELTLESELGKGATFTLKLPLSAAKI